MLIDWDPFPAIAAGVGPVEARRFLDADDFDFMGWNHGPDSGGTGPTPRPGSRRTLRTGSTTRCPTATHFPESLVGEVPGSVDDPARAARGRACRRTG